MRLLWHAAQEHNQRMASPSASIIITCYNLGAFLEEALQSALAQQHTDFEVVLIDDGSTDPQTLALLDSLPPHPRLRVLRTANQGVARARNHAISAAHGRYLLPLDADDRIHPSYLAQATAILDAHPAVGFVGCHYRIFGEWQGQTMPTSYRLPDMLIENAVPIASVYRRECWEAVGGYCPELNSIEDWDLWLGMLGKGYQGVVLPQFLFEYRIRPGSNLSHMRQATIYRARMQLLYQRHRQLVARTAVRLVPNHRESQQLLQGWMRPPGRGNWYTGRLALWLLRNQYRLQPHIAAIERATQAETSLPGKLGAVATGFWRVVRRKLRSG